MADSMGKPASELQETSLVDSGLGSSCGRCSSGRCHMVNFPSPRALCDKRPARLWKSAFEAMRSSLSPCRKVPHQPAHAQSVGSILRIIATVGYGRHQLRTAAAPSASAGRVFLHEAQQCCHMSHREHRWWEQESCHCLIRLVAPDCGMSQVADQCMRWDVAERPSFSLLLDPLLELLAGVAGLHKISPPPHISSLMESSRPLLYNTLFCDQRLPLLAMTPRKAFEKHGKLMNDDVQKRVCLAAWVAPQRTGGMGHIQSYCHSVIHTWFTMLWQIWQHECLFATLPLFLFSELLHTRIFSKFFQELVPGSFVWPLQHLQHTSANRWATHGALGDRLIWDRETWLSHVLSNNFNQYRGQWLIDVDCVDQHRIQIRPARPGSATEGCVFAQFSAEVNGFEWMRIWWSNIQMTRTNGTEGADRGTNPN